MSISQTFSILDHLDKLKPAKSGRYFCPGCNGHNLTINENSGAYQCWNGCSCKDIRDAIAPLPNQRYSFHCQSKGKPIKKLKLPALPGTDTRLAKLPAPATDSPLPHKDFDRERGEVLKTTYIYAQTPDGQPQRWVVRTDWTDASKLKERDKAFLQWHRSESGEAICKKGDEPWETYRENEFIKALKATPGIPVGLVQEGEAAVEKARSEAIASITFQGSAWKFDNLERAILRIKQECSNAILVFLCDNDSTGRDKAKMFQAACDRSEVFSVIIDPVAIYPELPDKGDIVEILAAMDAPQFIQRLEEEIHRAIEQRQQLEFVREIDKKTVEIDSDERLKLDLQELQGTDDPIRRMRRRAEIACYYRLSKVEIEESLKALRQRNVTPEPAFVNLADFLSQSEEPLDYIVPSLLPVGETVLLVAPPKVGKTLLAIDLSFAVATGEDTFLGEQCKRGRVLLVSVDESPSSTRSKLIKRGFRASDSESVQVMTRFGVSQMSALEERLESFRPLLVIVDSLRRINHGRQVTENSAEFADTIYSLKELLNQYRAAGVLIHHSCKDKEATGVNKVRGSSAIVGAAWGVWQLEQQLKEVGQGKAKKQVFDPKDPNRIFTAILRDAEGQRLRIELDPETNRWSNHGEEGEDSATAADTSSMRQRVRNILERNRHRDGLMVPEIRELLGLEPGDRTIYTTLSRMTDKREIWVHPSASDRRRMVYSLPQTREDTPPPTLSIPGVEQCSTKQTQQDFQDSQQLVNTPPKISQHLAVDKQVLNKSKLDTARNTGVSQHFESNRGGEGVANQLPDPVVMPKSEKTHQSAAENHGLKVSEVPVELKVGDRVAHKDEYHACFNCHGTIERMNDTSASVRWNEWVGKPREFDIYEFEELRRLD
jgi:AAA domain